MSLLDAEEQAILASVELGEWQSVPDLEQEIQRYQHYARSQVNVLETISIDLPASDLQSLQELAQKSGISVPLLIASMIHRFIANQPSSQS